MLQAADDGDAVAGTIADCAATELAATAAAAARTAGLLLQSIPLALAGGLLLGSASYRRRVVERLFACGIHPDPVNLVPEPAEGAVRRAIRGVAAGGVVSH